MSRAPVPPPAAAPQGEPEAVAVIGAGGHAKVVISCLRELGVAVAAALDDAPERWGADLLGVPVRGPVRELAAGFRRGVIAIGDNRTRRRLASDLDLEWRTVVHPRAWVDPTARLGPGAVVFAGAVVQPEAEIGAHAIVNTGASIDHDCRVGAYAHLGPGSRLCGRVRVGEGALIGAGSAVIPGVTIGAWTVVGAGAAVVRDLPDGAIAVGVPARVRPAHGASR